MSVSRKHLLYASRIAVACAALALAGCSRLKKHYAPGAADSADALRIKPYPRARWRLALPAELGRTVLWVSHIVVMHRDSAPTALTMRGIDWKPDPVQTRSWEEALKVAQDLAQRAQKDPTSFSRLARESSDDVVTKDRGGSLGAVEATLLPAEYLDAIAALPPGGVSNVLSTPMGLHVILKRSPPPNDDVAGLHVVIRYKSTFGFEPSERSREDALALSRKIIAEARSGADFPALVKKYSEGIDRNRGGDLGVRSTLEPGLQAPVIEALASVNPGDVLPEPVETYWGFEVAKRVPVTPHAELAARVVRALFDPGVPASEDDARKQADLLAEAVRHDPNAIASAASMERIRWFDGKGDPVLTSIVEALGVGQRTKDPVRLRNAFAMVERVEPDTFCQPPRPVFELPAPEWIDIEGLFRRGEPQALTRSVADLRALVSVKRFLPADARELDKALERLHSALLAATSPDERVAAYRREAGLLKKNISEASYAWITTGIQEWLAERLINPPTPASPPNETGSGAVTRLNP